MKRLQKDRRYQREDYKAHRDLEQIFDIDGMQLSVRLQSPPCLPKVKSRLPKQIQQSMVSCKATFKESFDTHPNILFTDTIHKVRGQALHCQSLHKEFLELCEESRHYMEYYIQKNSNKFTNLLKKDNRGKCGILLILKSRFPELEGSSLSQRKLLAMGINPSDDFEEISWQKYSLLRKLMTEKSVSILESVKFLLNFFIPNGEASTPKEDFVVLLCSILREYSMSCSKKSGLSDRFQLVSCVTARLETEPLLKNEEITRKKMKELFSKQCLFSCSDFLYVLFKK